MSAGGGLGGAFGLVADAAPMLSSPSRGSTPAVAAPAAAAEPRMASGGGTRPPSSGGGAASVAARSR
eukprot:365396-Chlamydomonas_euryale.AAC.2